MNLSWSFFLWIFFSFLIVYILLGYPLLLAILSKLLPRPHKGVEGYTPTLTFVISAYNEESVIRQKIENALASDYPKKLLNIIVVSDCSSDGTDAIVQEYAASGVSLVRLSERLGKTAGLNLAMSRIQTELVVFSDANAIYDSTALSRLARHFSDQQIGYVVGQAKYQKSDQSSAAETSEVAYWQIETKMKVWESELSSVVGGDGAIYAIRANLYEPMLVSDINDFVNPLQIIAKGYRGIFDPTAICYEYAGEKFEKEYGRKVRIVNRSLNGLLRVPVTLNPLRTGFFAWQVVSHKLLRWFMPYWIILHWLAALAAANVGQRNRLAELTLAGYAIFSLLALIGSRQQRPASGRIFFLPYYFSLMNLAAGMGVWRRLRGETITTWSTVRAAGGKNPGVSYLSGILVCILLFSCWGLLRPELSVVIVKNVIITLIVLLGYAFLGYPILLVPMARFFPISWKTDPEYFPTVTLLIAAYNEEKVIEQKIRNSLELHYPQDRLHILIVSDGSTDATNDIVAQLAEERVTMLYLPKNQGKASALNHAMEHINSDIVLFSDANVMYEENTIRHLTSHFVDSRVGAVSGKVILSNDSLSYGNAERVYYSIEHFIQAYEGLTGGVIGADGGMYAIRRNLFTPLDDGTILDDFVISMRIARQGFLVLCDPLAVGFEQNVNEIGAEFRRKTRIIAGGLQCLLRGDSVPRLSQGLLLFKFISHKVLRWLCGPVGLLLITFLFGLSWRQEADPVHSTMLLIFLAGAVLAGLGQIFPLARSWKVIGLPHYLSMLFLSSIVGCWLGLTCGQKVTWRQN